MFKAIFLAQLFTAVVGIIPTPLDGKFFYIEYENSDSNQGMNYANI